MSSTFDVCDVTCKQHTITALNPFLNGTKNVDADGTCKRNPDHTNYKLLRIRLINLERNSGHVLSKSRPMKALLQECFRSETDNAKKYF